MSRQYTDTGTTHVPVIMANVQAMCDQDFAVEHMMNVCVGRIRWCANKCVTVDGTECVRMAPYDLELVSFVMQLAGLAIKGHRKQKAIIGIDPWLRQAQGRPQ